MKKFFEANLNIVDSLKFDNNKNKEKGKYGNYLTDLRKRWWMRFDLW